MSATIRAERAQDINAIREVSERAFGQSLEGRLVDPLRSNGGVMLSLVAVIEDRVVGHILYSPVSLISGNEIIMGAGLGQMAVLPEFHGQGIGGRLIEAGTQRLRGMGCPFVVVVGHPEYCPRFGFQPAAGYGIKCGWEVPDDVFMVLILDQSKMKDVAGLAKYREEFSAVA
ncbi:MAG: N-acetyltransferase [Pseudomonadota bacterium]